GQPGAAAARARDRALRERPRLASPGLGPGRGAAVHARRTGRADQHAQRIPARLLPAALVGAASAARFFLRRCSPEPKARGSSRSRRNRETKGPGVFRHRGPAVTRGGTRAAVARGQSAWTTRVPAIRAWPQRRSLRKISSTLTIWIRPPRNGITPTACTGR